MKEKSDLDLVICSSCQATSYTRVAHRIREHPLSLKVLYFTIYRLKLQCVSCFIELTC